MKLKDNETDETGNEE